MTTRLRPTARGLPDPGGWACAVAGVVQPDCPLSLPCERARTDSQFLLPIADPDNRRTRSPPSRSVRALSTSDRGAMNGLADYLLCYLSIKKALLAAGALAGLAGAWLVLRRRGAWLSRVVTAVAFAYMAVQVAVAIHIFLNHLQFPLYLQQMEGVTAMHLDRLAMGLPLYVAPSAQFIPLAYNPGFYVACLPVYAFVGAPLVSMRLVSGLAYFALGGLVGYAVHLHGARRAVTALAVGAYFSAYMVFDAYLDTGHPDSLFVFLAVCAWIVMWRRPTHAGRLAAIVILVAAFWVKQHGAIFVLGALTYITCMERSWRVWPYWAVAAIGGPAAYLLLGPVLFGPEFHHYTYRVPSSWSCLTPGGAVRLAGYLVLWAPSLVLAWQWWRRGAKLRDPWTWGMGCAVCAATLGVMDTGSSNNVLILWGLWCLLLGSFGLGLAWRRDGGRCRVGLLGVYVVQLVVLVFNPADALTDSRAAQSYDDLVAALARTHTPIYAVQMGRLPPPLPAAAHAGWVPLADLTRGKTEGRDDPLTHEILSPLASRPVCLLTNWPLENDDALRFLLDRFQQVEDFGDRFRALRILPTRFGTHWPRYLYANSLAMASAAQLNRVALVDEHPSP